MAKKEVIVPMDYEAIEQKIRWAVGLDLNGYASVELCDVGEKIILPKQFYLFCLQYSMEPHIAINMIVSDFVTRYYKGNNAYEQGLINRVRCADITESEREKFLKILLNE